MPLQVQTNTRRKNNVESSWERDARIKMQYYCKPETLFYYEITTTSYDKGKILGSEVDTFFCTSQDLLSKDKEKRKQDLLSDSNNAIDKENENHIKKSLSWGLTTSFVFSEIKQMKRPDYINPKAGVNHVASFKGKFR